MAETMSDEATAEFCRNCDAPLTGRFCSNCGQENEPSRPTFGVLMRDVWGDFLQVDAKLLKTLTHLVLRPGFLTHEYLAGRRIRYISPFKLYFWATALFVLFTFRLFYLEDEDLLKMNASVIAEEKSAQTQGKAAASRTQPLPALFPTRPFQFFGINVDPRALPDSVQDYDNEQHNLPRTQRDDPWTRITKIKLIHYKKNPIDTLRSLIYGALPNILIFAVPLWALLMKPFFWRPPRLYVEHLVFALHGHTYAVLVIALHLVLGKYWLPGRLDQISFAALLALLGYNLLAARRVYGQGLGKLLVKGGCLTIGYGVILTVAIGLGLLVTAIATFFNL